ncbi:MAG: CvpA family protein, partial [Kineothrix sp.]|nr:CvpA family protein [Kineothrix sp.]
MKKWVRNLIFILLALAAAFVYYYISLPAINIHSSGFWMFIITILLVIMVVYAFRKTGKGYVESEVMAKFGIKFNTFGLRESKVFKGLGILLLFVVAVYLIGSILSSPIVNARKYQALLTSLRRILRKWITVP